MSKVKQKANLFEKGNQKVNSIFPKVETIKRERRAIVSELLRKVSVDSRKNKEKLYYTKSLNTHYKRTPHTISLSRYVTTN